MLSPLQLEDVFIVSMNLRTDRYVVDMPLGDWDDRHQVPQTVVEVTEITGDAERIEMDMRIRVNPKRADFRRMRYALDLGLAGIFRYGNMSDQQLNELLTLNAPAMLYGVARGIAAQAFAMTGLGKVILPTVDFVAVMRRFEQREQKALGVD